jgi:zinc finger CCCH domain-containing protein 13
MEENKERYEERPERRGEERERERARERERETERDRERERETKRDREKTLARKPVKCKERQTLNFRQTLVAGVEVERGERSDERCADRRRWFDGAHGRRSTNDQKDRRPRSNRPAEPPRQEAETRRTQVEETGTAPRWRQDSVPAGRKLLEDEQGRFEDPPIAWSD